MYNPVQAATAEDSWIIGSEVIATPFPMFHIAGLSGFLGGIIAAGHVLLIPDPRNLEVFCGLLKKFPPTRLGAVPALYQMMVGSDDFKSVDFSRLKVARSGAAPMPNAVYEDLRAIIGDGVFADAFGMTETSPCYTVHPPARYKPGSVGFPMPSASVRIVDTEDPTKEMPLGEPGEICTAGPQVMKEYLNLPDETANSLREYDGKIWMHTGDVGYMDDEGYIFLCDRAKDMLIVGGYKVFSVEIEDKLKSLPTIEVCAIIGKPDENRPGNDIVTLFVQPTDPSANQEAMSEEIINYCREHMAAYKVPKQVKFVDAIPLTAVGKIDKKLLRAQL